MKKDDILNDNSDIENTPPAHFGGFILSNSKRNMIEFIREINGFYNNGIYYGDNDSLYKEKKYWDVLDKTKMIGEELCRSENDYESGGIFYRLFLAPKLKQCLTIDKCGVIQEHKTFEEFNDSKRLLDRSQSFDMLKGKKDISYVAPKSEKII